MWGPRPAGELPLDPALTSAYRAESSGAECCYSACVAAPVRPRGVSAHDYRRSACIPEMSTSTPAPGHPRCPAALALPDDYPGHVAAFDPRASEEQAQRWRAAGLFDLGWCCYGSAPLAAIGPL
jgi:hypothetical protein